MSGIQDRQLYNWKRFWFKRDDPINLTDDGYLFDPDSEYGQFLNPSALSLNSINHIPCLALLGEPGIGKSTTLIAERETVDAGIKESGGQTLWLDLRSFSSEDRLMKKLFENEVFIRWVKGTHKLYVFLDSLDEGLLQIKSLAKLLIDELQEYPVERLLLRITCRSAEWPQSLEVGLRELWSEKDVEVYQLGPLREKDVIEAAKSREIEAELFLNEIERKGVQPLAIKPITLELLLNNYLRTGHFPDTQLELYLKGGQLLCEEVNLGRSDSGLKGTFRAEQKLAVAARIAALTIFANRYAISTNIDVGNIPEEDLTIGDLCGGYEPVFGESLKVNESVVRETLATGLFVSRGPGRLGWAHQTFAECLAARYLIIHDMSVKQIMSILTHSGDVDGKLVPQLHETSAWLSGMKEEIFREIMKCDPEVLLRSGAVVGADFKTRADIVESLLRQYDNKVLMNAGYGNSKDYKNLSHPGLAGQLRLYILDNTKNNDARNVAINIAKDCSLHELVDDLIDIAIDIQQPYLIRKKAAYAISRIANHKNSNLNKLKPLISVEGGDDPEDEFKGNALRALWPSYLTGEELFAALTNPKKENFVGSYVGFLMDLVNYSWGEDIHAALMWVKIMNVDEKYRASSLSQLMEAILKQGYQNLDKQGVINSFAGALLSSLSITGRRINLYKYNGDENAEGNWLDDEKKRRHVLKALIPLLQENRKKLFLVLFAKPQLVYKKDVFWMIECLKESNSVEEKKVWGEFIARVYDRDNVEQLNAIIPACQIEPVLSEILGLNTVILDSPEAKKMRADFEETQEILSEAIAYPSPEAPQSAEIVEALDEFDSGDLSAWVKLNGVLAIGENVTPYGNELEPNITKLPGWLNVDESTQKRIVKAAEKFIKEYHLKTDRMHENDRVIFLEISSIKAFFLLFHQSNELVISLPQTVWVKWLQLIIDFPNWDNYTATLIEIRKIAYRLVPEMFKKTVSMLLDRDIKEGRSTLITDHIKACLDVPLVNVLASKIKQNSLKPEAWGQLLEILLKFNSREAGTYAESILTLPLPSADDEKKRAAITAEKLILFSDDAGWPVIWTVFQENKTFGKDVISAVADHSDGNEHNIIGSKLTDEQLTDFYIWLETQFPQSEDPELKDFGPITPRFTIARWKNAILNSLVERGTHKACEGIRKIMRVFPEMEGLEWVLYEAKRETRLNTWLPFQPEDIIKMSENSRNRLVQNGNQLLDVLVESLKRLEQKLHSETPTVRFIWDYNNKTRKYRPIDENSFSDYVKIHLQEELNKLGIIVNREVQIHRGERTDIHVDTIVKSKSEIEKISVIIEVKGCWNSELKHAMETQLVDRYLKNNYCRHGLYLVGWFYCDQWDDEDSRKQKTPRMTQDEAQDQFHKQASEISQNGVKIRAFIMNTGL